MGMLTRRQLSALAVAIVLMFGFELGAVWFGVRWVAREQYVSQRRLELALMTIDFRRMGVRRPLCQSMTSAAEPSSPNQPMRAPRLGSDSCG